MIIFPSYKLCIQLLFLILLFLNISCSKSFDELNTNPKQATSVSENTVFLAGEKNLANTYATSLWSVAPFRVISQAWTQVANINEARYSFTTNDAPSGWWNALYTSVLGNLENAKEIIQAKGTLSAEDQNKLAITNILEVYSFHLLVNTYGDIPYTEGLSKINAFPPYDSATYIVKDLIARLDTAVNQLSSTASSFGQYDNIYNGDVTKWKLFANTLRLKLALLFAGTEPSYAKNQAEISINNGVISSSDQDGKFSFYTTNVNSSNPLWVDLVNGTYATYYAPAGYLVHVLDSLNDPRLALYFTKDVNGSYSGAVAGLGGVKSNLSGFSSFWLAQSAPTYLLDYVETEFLLAEAIERGYTAPGTAANHYNNAIVASIVQAGGTTSAGNTYLSGSDVSYSSSQTWQQKIGYQKWLAFANRNWDSWTEIRRLKYPNINVVSNPISAISSFPERFYYPSAEQTSNNKNWSIAVSRLGGKDDVTSLLFWEK